jgi:hypothetical protein
MESEFDFKKYVDWNVYAVTYIRGKYGFRIVLNFSDGTTSTQQKSGQRKKRGRQEMLPLHSYMQGHM